MFILIKNHQTFSKVVVTFLFPSEMHKISSYSTSLTTLDIVSLSPSAILMHILWYIIMILLCVSLTSMNVSFFHMFIGQLDTIFCEVHIHVLCPVFSWVVFLFIIDFFNIIQI